MNPDAWSPDRPETDQCAVTACLLHDLFGMTIVRGQAILPDGSIDSHYWCEGLDLTIDQFPEGTRTIKRDEGPQGEEAYAYLMTNPDLRARYAILLEAYHANA